jgi:hypothetical protein
MGVGDFGAMLKNPLPFIIFRNSMFFELGILKKERRAFFCIALLVGRRPFCTDDLIGSTLRSRGMLPAGRE